MQEATGRPDSEIKVAAAKAAYGRGDYPSAIALFVNILASGVADPDVWHHLAVCHHQCRDYVKAYEAYREALSLAPHDASIWYHAAKALKDDGQFDLADRHYQTALSLNPDSAECLFSQGLLFFLRGDWLAGWRRYELRWQGFDRAEEEHRVVSRLPEWTGESVPAGSALIVYSEQGLGDSIMMYRFARELRRRFTRVLFSVQMPLVSLFALNAIQGVEVCTRISLPLDETGYSHRVNMMSLPHVLGIHGGNCPAVPYLAADRKRIAAWAGRMPSQPGKRRIGLVWRGGNLTHVPARDMPFQALSPLLEHADILWFSLQKDAGAEGAGRLIDLMPMVADMADTAAIIANLDLIIAVDTAVAHVAAAMGKQVWLLNRYESEWRWQYGHSRSPWYPSVCIFTQPTPGDWGSAIDEMCLALFSPPIPVGDIDPILVTAANQRPEDALLALAPVMAQYPENLDILRHHAVAALKAGRADLALAVLKRIRVFDQGPAVKEMMRDAWSMCGRASSALLLAAEIRTRSDGARTETAYVNMLIRAGHAGEVLNISADPLHRANALSGLGRFVEAASAVGAAINQPGQGCAAYPSYVRLLPHLPGATSDAVLEQIQVADGFLPPLTVAARRASSTGMVPVKVAYVMSCDGMERYGDMVAWIVDAHDRAIVNPCLYLPARRFQRELGRTKPSLPATLKWVDVSDFNGTQLIQRLRADGVEVLVDAGGADSAELIELYQGAEVGLKLRWLKDMPWLGQGDGSCTITCTMATEGTDADPALGARQLILPRLDAAWPAPAAARGPVKPGGRVVALCLDPAATLSDTFLSLCADVMAQRPELDLVLPRPHVETAVLPRWAASCFSPVLVNQGRLRFLPATRHPELMPRALAMADIVLEPFPVPHADISFRALALGVPVLALTGMVPAARLTASVLRSAGLEDCLASSKSEYARRLLAFCDNPHRLASRAASLQGALSKAGFFDRAGLTRWLERAYQTMAVGA